MSLLYKNIQTGYAELKFWLSLLLTIAIFTAIAPDVSASCDL